MRGSLLRQSEAQLVLIDQSPAEQSRLLHPSTKTSDRVSAIGMWVLGFAAAQGRYIDQLFGQLRLSLMLAVVFGTFGWWQGITDPALRRYLRWAVPFVAIGGLSLVAAPARSPLAARFLSEPPEQIAKLGWFLLIPGLAAVIQNRRLFRALTRGMLFGASIFLTAALWHALKNQPALNSQHELLNTSRGIVDFIVVWLLPAVFVSTFLNLRPWVRYAYVGGTVVWLINSRGRAGILALFLAPIAYYMLRPLKTGKPAIARIAFGATACFFVFFLLSNVTLSFAPALSRLAQAQGENKSDSDEIRILLQKKALALTEKHPFLGLGMGRVEGAYDPVVEHAKNDYVWKQSIALRPHNVYLEAFAATGVVGGLVFIGLLTAPLAIAIRECHDKELRAIAAGYCVVLFMMMFAADFEANLFLGMTLTLAGTVRVARQRMNLGTGEVGASIDPEPQGL